MRLKDKRDQRTIEPSRFALGIPAMDARNDALGYKPHVRAGVNTSDLKLVSMTNGDYINSRIGGHTSTFSKEQLNNILHATPSVPGETEGADKPAVELDGPVKDGKEVPRGPEDRMPTDIITDTGDDVMPPGLLLAPVSTVAELNTALKDVTGPVSGKDVYQKVSQLYASSNTGVSLRQSRNGAEIFVGGDSLSNSTVANLEMAISIMKQLKEGAEGKGQERITSDLRKLKRTLKTKLADKTSVSSDEGDDEAETKPAPAQSKKIKLKLKSKKLAAQGGGGQ
jgi:hypothetical protein